MDDDFFLSICNHNAIAWMQEGGVGWSVSSRSRRSRARIAAGRSPIVYLAGRVLHEAERIRRRWRRSKREMGNANFSAQYLQEPLPGGSDHRLEWFRDSTCYRRFNAVVQSWAVASLVAARGLFGVHDLGLVDETYYLIESARQLQSPI